MDRFQPILQSENLCFLCLQPASNICDKCSVPYCNQEHYKVHYNEDTDYCYPFRVLQKPEVMKIVLNKYGIYINFSKTKYCRYLTLF